ncbi:hypothetical protein M9458_034677, partial [Cirrhinus mrigala]
FQRLSVMYDRRYSCRAMMFIRCTCWPCCCQLKNTTTTLSTSSRWPSANTLRTS